MRYRKNDVIVIVVSLTLCVVEIIAIIVSIIFTERALNKTFDKDGNKIIRGVL